MHLREALLQSGAEIKKILKRQVGMEPANNVKLGDGFGISGSCCFESFIKRHGVGARRVLLAAKGAETAGGHADVRGIDVAVDVEIRFIAVHPLADVVGHPANGENVAGTVEGESVGCAEALDGKDFGVDRLEPRIVGLERMMARSGHLLDDIAGKHSLCRADTLSAAFGFDFDLPPNHQRSTSKAANRSVRSTLAQ